MANTIMRSSDGELGDNIKKKQPTIKAAPFVGFVGSVELLHWLAASGPLEGVVCGDQAPDDRRDQEIGAQDEQHVRHQRRTEVGDQAGPGERVGQQRQALQTVQEEETAADELEERRHRVAVEHHARRRHREQNEDEVADDRRRPQSLETSPPKKTNKQTKNTPHPSRHGTDSMAGTGRQRDGHLSKKTDGLEGEEHDEEMRQGVSVVNLAQRHALVHDPASHLEHGNEISLGESIFYFFSEEVNARRGLRR